MNFMGNKNFLIEEYCARKGKEKQELTETECDVLHWAAEQMDVECLVVLDISHAPQEWDETTVRVTYICFQIEFLWDDEFEGNITYEVGLLGFSFFEYETRELGLTKEDIQGFIDDYRKYENEHT